MTSIARLRRLAAVAYLVLFVAAFSLRAEVTLTTLVTFDSTNGCVPQSGLVHGRDGNFYGVLSYGGWFDAGTLFRMAPNGKCVILVTFGNGNGTHPASLIQGKDGNFYGTTLEGGQSGNGSIFKMTPDGTITTLATFSDDISYGPYGLVQGQDGNLYGKMSQLTRRYSTFEVTLDGRIIIPAPNGMPPTDTSDKLLKANDGNSYGTTLAGFGNNRPGFVFGTVFKIGSDSARTVLIAFDRTNGANPLPDLAQGQDGNIYGITTSGGAFKQGTIFRLNLKDAGNSTAVNESKINVPVLIHAVSNNVDPRIMRLMQAPIEFYGKVLDDNSNVVSEADISFNWTDLTARGFENSATAKSDNEGLFSLKDKQGASLTVSVSKQGYYPRNGIFWYTPDRGPFRSDKNNPYVFRLHQKGPGVDLITSQYGMSPDFPIHIPRDGTPVRVDLMQRKVGGAGQMIITENKPESKDWQHATQWSFNMEIPDGGFRGENDEYPYEAPADGYQSLVRFDFQKNLPNWTTGIRTNFYVKFGNPPVYGRLQIQTGIYNGGAYLTYAINPSGSRDLEPK